MIKYRDILINVFGKPIEISDNTLRTKDWFVAYNQFENSWRIMKYNYYLKTPYLGIIMELNPITEFNFHSKYLCFMNNINDLQENFTI